MSVTQFGDEIEQRVPGHYFRAMAALFLERNPRFSKLLLTARFQTKLRAHDLSYHHRTITRQLSGSISTVRPELVGAMKEVFSECSGLQAVLDIDKVLVKASLWSEQFGPRRIASQRLLPLVRLWLYLNPNRSQRSLASRLQKKLIREGTSLALATIERCLARKQPSAPYAMQRQLLESLKEHGITSEEDAVARCKFLSDAIQKSEEDRRFTSGERFYRLCYVWKLVNREPSSRRLANLIQKQLRKDRMMIGIDQLQEIINHKRRKVRRSIVRALEDLLLEKLCNSRELERRIGTISPFSGAVQDLRWIRTGDITQLAGKWLSLHPGVSRRQLAVRLHKAIVKMGFSMSLGTLEQILHGRRRKTRGFVYRAMLEELRLVSEPGEGHELSRADEEVILESQVATVSYLLDKTVGEGREIAEKELRKLNSNWIASIHFRRLAHAWLRHHPGVSSHRYAIKIQKIVHRMGYSVDLGTLHAALRGPREKVRRFVYEASVTAAKERTLRVVQLSSRAQLSPPSKHRSGSIRQSLNQNRRRGGRCPTPTKRSQLESG